MNFFYPKKFKKLKVYFNLIGGQKETKTDPGIQPYIEFKEINIYNRVILPEDLESYLIETFGEQWEKEILNEFWY